MRRIVETLSRGCENSSFSNTQDILNILIGSLLKHERSKESVILRDTGQFSGEGLTDDVW